MASPTGLLLEQSAASPRRQTGQHTEVPLHVLQASQTFTLGQCSLKGMRDLIRSFMVHDFTDQPAGCCPSQLWKRNVL